MIYDDTYSETERAVKIKKKTQFCKFYQKTIKFKGVKVNPFMKSKLGTKLKYT